jgi:hypothetical protein
VAPAHGILGAAMYRIRLASGEEQTYRSIQELTAGVQRGEVASSASIYHQRTDRWLPIESHPHYRMAREGAAPSAAPAAEDASPVATSTRLRFQRPANPVSPSAVRPTPPPAQKPDSGDLEELNRLLLLIDPASNGDQPPALPANESPADAASPEAVEESAPVPEEPRELESLKPLDEVTPVAAADPDVPGEPEEPAVAEPDLPIPVRLEPMPPMPSAQTIEVVHDILPPAAVLPVEQPFRFPLPAPSVEATVVPPAPVGEFATPALSPSPAPVERRRMPRQLKPALLVAVGVAVIVGPLAYRAWAPRTNDGVVDVASATASSGQQPTVGFPLPPAPESVAIQSARQASLDSAAAADSSAAAQVLPSAPQVSFNGTGSVSVASSPGAGSRRGVVDGTTLARGYAQAYQAARQELNARMDESGLVRLFGQTQLSSADGLAGARRALDVAEGAIRQYRTREAGIERAYQDSAKALERSGASQAEVRGWMTRPNLRETQEAASESALFLKQVDGVLALLQAQRGHYQITGETIRFDDPAARASYGELRGWITRRTEYWADQSPSAVPPTVKPILDGIGLTRLPRER